MWQQPIDDHFLELEAPKDVPVPNFNPFDILEPQKVNIEDNILVDLATNENKPVKETDSNLQMGSFIDTVTKTEYNLLDLYQNIYVTPQHIKKPTNNTNRDNLIDFTNFFDKLEIEDKGNNKDEEETKYLDNTSKRRDKIWDFDEIFDKVVESSIHKTDSMACKELAEVPEVTSKTTKNKVDPIDKNEMVVTKPNCEDINNCLPMSSKQPSYQINSDFAFIKDENELKHEENLKHNNYVYNKSFEHEKESYLNFYQIKEQTVQEAKKNSDKNQNEKCCECHNTRKVLNTNLNHKIVDETDLLHTSNNENSHYIPKDLKIPPVLKMLVNNQFNCQIKPGQLLQTAIKDEKLYAKQQRILTNNKGLTVGPDIYEKSIVLPQIMKRLAARKKIIDDQMKFKRRLVLDSGVSTKHEGNNQNVYGIGKTIVLMEDCNRFRLADLKLRTSFEKFVKTGTLHS